ncbi:MAG: HK97-gp10 family putative phage morphogenesis protein [Mycobacteriales bacterium]
MEGLAEVEARLAAAVAAMSGPAPRETVHLVISGAVETARSLVRVDTGELRDSIHTETDERGSVVEGLLVVDSDHAVENEYGTSHMSAQPFVRPAMHRAAARLTPTAAAVYRRTVPGMS